LPASRSNAIFDSKFIDCSEGPLSSLVYIVAIMGERWRRQAVRQNREGKAMMFLIRTAFWLLILILLLPTDREQQARIYGTAQSAVNDVAGFCDRNPQTCATGQDALDVVAKKAEFGAQVLIGFIEQQTGASGESAPFVSPSDGNVMPVPAAASPVDPVTWDTNSSQDTLLPKDREAAWSGPGA
jgi:hypothetical protein